MASRRTPITMIYARAGPLEVLVKPLYCYALNRGLRQPLYKKEIRA